MLTERPGAGSIGGAVSISHWDVGEQGEGCFSGVCSFLFHAAGCSGS